MKIQSININNLINSHIKERELILSPWLTSQSLSMIYAPRGIGKTHVSLGIACAVASGESFLRWDATKPRGVLFVDSEMSMKDLQNRVKNILKMQSRQPKAPLVFITPDMQENGLMPDLSTEDGQQLVEAFIKPEIDLIILDNLSSLMNKSPHSWLLVQKWLLHLRSIGKSVLIIHHANKLGKQRGTSRREDALDCVINLRKPKDYSAEQGSRFQVYFEKARSLFGDTVKPFEARLIREGLEQRWDWHLLAPMGEKPQAQSMEPFKKEAAQKIFEKIAKDYQDSFYKLNIKPDRSLLIATTAFENACYFLIHKNIKGFITRMKFILPKLYQEHQFIKSLNRKTFHLYNEIYKAFKKSMGTLYFKEIPFINN